MGLVKKQVDPRIRSVLEAQIRRNHRTFFLIIGDHGRDQVVNLHYLCTKLHHTSTPLSVLWCYKRDLDMSQNRKRRMHRLKTAHARGLVEPSETDPFDHFVASARVKFLYYRDVHRVVGQTFGVCVLQDFEAMTANVLAQTIETVSGGGLIILLLNTMASLKQLYTINMDIYAHLRNAADGAPVVPRFNRRFFLSLTRCPSCLVLDDELNVLSVSDISRSPAAALDHGGDGRGTTSKRSAKRTDPAAAARLPSLVPVFERCKTEDQSKVIAAILTNALDRPERSQVTIAVTAGRGRGKSAVLGLAIAMALILNFSNIFVTAPSPSQTQTIFQFAADGLEAAGWHEGIDYVVAQASRSEWRGCVIKISGIRANRQTVQYVLPTDLATIGVAELVVIDEAAAIPAPMVSAILDGSQMVTLLASTIDGYEGTGRTLSYKLLRALEQRASASGGRPTAAAYQHVSMTEPIRYASSDPVEHWIEQLLCLAAPRPVPEAGAGADAGPIAELRCPAPQDCQLYAVNRDALFSYHPAAEAFLAQLIAIFVASHYKNSPNDLQLLADAPSHRLFVLAPPVQPTDTRLPHVIAAIQVCVEGGSDTIRPEVLARGQLPSGDMVPWTLVQQFQEPEFGAIRGLRIVRIAVHPDLQGMGYGSAAVQRLSEAAAVANGTWIAASPLLQHHQGPQPGGDGRESAGNTAAIAGGDGDDDGEPPQDDDAHTHLLLLASPSDEAQWTQHHLPGNIRYLSTSFGLTLPLLKFWIRVQFESLYLRLTPNALTGEHTTIMLRALDRTIDPDWLHAFREDYSRRITRLLSVDPIRQFPCELATLMADPNARIASDAVRALRAAPPSAVLDTLAVTLTPHDWNRLEAYARHFLDYHVVLDLLPALAMPFFDRLRPEGDAPTVTPRLSPAQRLILVGLGLQRKAVETIATEVGILPAHVMALFNKVIRKFVRAHQIHEKHQIQAEERASWKEPMPTRPGDAAHYRHPFVVPETISDNLPTGAYPELQPGTTISAPIAKKTAATKAAAA